jgi:hypothetical protein
MNKKYSRKKYKGGANPGEVDFLKGIEKLVEERKALKQKEMTPEEKKINEDLFTYNVYNNKWFSRYSIREKDVIKLIYSANEDNKTIKDKVRSIKGLKATLKIKNNKKSRYIEDEDEIIRLESEIPRLELENKTSEKNLRGKLDRLESLFEDVKEEREPLTFEKINIEKINIGGKRRKKRYSKRYSKKSNKVKRKKTRNKK